MLSRLVMKFELGYVVQTTPAGTDIGDLQTLPAQHDTKERRDSFFTEYSRRTPFARKGQSLKLSHDCQFVHEVRRKTCAKFDENASNFLIRKHYDLLLR
jgi:hypothetical protein